MLKKISLRKIGLTSIALFAILLIYLIPSNDKRIEMDTQLEYVSTNTSSIFLLDKDNYVSLTKVVLSDTQIENKAKELLNILIEGNSEKIPNGFKAIIPTDTKINSLIYDKGLIKVDFSDEILDINEELEEKMIEAIVYTLTSIDDVNKVIIYIDGEILTKLPKTKVNLPSTLDRSFGINKKYEFTSLEKIAGVTIYYVNKNNDSYYYIPVTKYINDEREKITIIVDELANNYDNSLMSFINNNAKLVASSITDGTLTLDFNENIFDDITTKDILEEVVYTICLSAFDNYDIDNIVFTSNNKIYETVSKTIENGSKI